MATSASIPCPRQGLAWPGTGLPRVKPARFRAWLVLLPALLIWAGAGMAATIPNVPPLVSTSAFANVMFDMSVEWPMGGAAYADQNGNPAGCTGRIDQGGWKVGACYFPGTTYLGIFDPAKCYKYASGQFNLDTAATSHSCGSGQWSGNFLNWATMTASDMFIWTLTGGDRVTDGASETILRRARAIDSSNNGVFPVKYLANATGAAPFGGAIYISNQNGYQFKVGTSLTGNQLGTYDVKVKVCDPAKGLETNCKGYTSGGTTVYKPEGLIQRHADKMRFGVFAYTNDNSQSRDGGVLRAPMRYVGEKQMDGGGNLIANTAMEINPATGQIYPNPLSAGGGWSGVINYINKFHNDWYKSIDPIGEMFYEVIRYFKNLGRTPEYANGAGGGSFPIYTSWNDPIQFYCQKNFVVAINDANPWLDKRLPGTFFTCDKSGQNGLPAFTAGDCGPPSNPDSNINVSSLTRQVGQMEGLHTTWTENYTTGTDTVGYVYGAPFNPGSDTWCSHTESVSVSDLSQVMGTCPYTPKQNSYYIAGLAYYANTADLRSDLKETQTLNSFFIDTQEYSDNPLSGNKNMLYLAGKYGGFTDLNDNKEPDLATEWDADGDGQPDNYVVASTPDKLVKGLERAFNNILEKTASSGNVAANSAQLSSDTAVFQAIYKSGVWSGDLLAYAVTSTGVAATTKWKASANVPSPVNRKIFTVTGGAAKAFQWANLSPADQTALRSSDLVDYLRGDRSKEVRKGGSFRDREAGNVLGDIIHSAPFYVKDNDTVYIGANDGMLHAFNAATGAERFAFIPSAVISRLAKISEPAYTHEYFVDGGISVSTQKQTPGHNYLVAALGHGGKGLFGLDVANPAGFATTDVEWEYYDDADLGYVLGRPLIAKMNDGSWAVILGNGYNSSTGTAALYILDLKTGALLKKIDTGIASDNGLAAPGLIDTDADGDIDFIFAGDLKGNLWKFDVSGSNKNKWDVAFKTKISGKDVPQPFFTAKSTDGSAQPITAQITLATNDVRGDPNYGKHFIFFGTGSYFRSTDPGDTQIESWYGLIDDASTAIAGRALLTKREILQEGSFAGHTVRTFKVATAGDMAGRSGWYLDFTTHPGERIVSASWAYRLAEPVLIASSVIPETDPCLSGGSGFVNAINPFTGARLSAGVFDLNDNNKMDDDLLNNVAIGGFDPGVGMPGEPVIVGDRLVVGGSKGGTPEDVPLPPGNTQGRLSWREILR